MSDDLVFEVGIYEGAAVAYCPQTGHIATVPLRETANSMRRKGEISEVGAELMEALDYADDRPTVGAGKVAKKIKKVVKKVAAVAKKVANSKLGKALITAASIAAGPIGGAAISALKMGIGIAKNAKASKAKAKTPAQKKQVAAAKATAPIAAKLAKKQITPKQAKAQAKKKGIPAKNVMSAAVSLRITAAAKKGNPKAKELVRAATAIDRAESNPQPLSIAPTEEAPDAVSPFTQSEEAAPIASFDFGGGGDGGGGFEAELEFGTPPEELPEFEELDQVDESVDEGEGGEEYPDDGEGEPYEGEEASA